MDFNRAVTYPMQSDDWLKTVLIGGVLLFFGFLFVPLFVVYGYVVRTIRSSLSEETTPPSFGEWGALIKDGVQAWLIGVVYLLVPLVVAALTIGGSIGAMATGGDVGAAAGAGGLLFGLAISAVLWLAFGYLAVIAVVNFAREDRFGAAFDVDVIRTIALDREYAIAWLVSVGVFLAASLVSAIPLLGWILTPFASFYAAVVAANLWAGGFAQALESKPDIDRSREGEAPV